MSLLWIIFLVDLTTTSELYKLTSINGDGGDETRSIRSNSIKILRNRVKNPSPQVLSAISKCESAIKNAINDLDPRGPSFCLGLLKQSLGDLEGAIESYKRAVQRLSTNGLALGNMGAIHENLGQDEDAESCYTAALHVLDIQDNVFISLVQLLLRNNNDMKAKALCESVISTPKSTLTMRYLALKLLGTIYHKQKLFHESMNSYDQALKLFKEPSSLKDIGENYYLEALRNVALIASTLSKTEQSNEMAEKAERHFLNAIELAPEDADTYTHYGVFLKDHGRLNDAEETLRKAIALDPSGTFKETGYAIVQLASLTNGSLQTSMSKSYVRSLFDSYSERFDEELCNTLKYQGHEQVVEAVKNLNPRKDKLSLVGEVQGIVVDIGCGTGLCGELLRNLFTESIIHGVDLSPRMLMKAEARGCYDILTVADASDYLLSLTPASSHLVVAADVFIYIGDLLKVFEAIGHVLRTDGILAFTVELLEEEIHEKINVRLLPCGRFGHSKMYIRGLADRFGFDILTEKREVLREQRGVPVPSITYVLSKK